MRERGMEICVRCMTYNHVKYVKETLDGFCMQKTSIPYVCVIVDDCSKDGEAELIKDYVNKNFDLDDRSVVRKEENDNYVLTYARHKTNKNCHFVVLQLKYNHYLIRKPKYPYLSEWVDNAKYIAICEGDDYWTDQYKLQVQFDYMESHHECVMTCHRAYLYSEKKKKIIGEQYCRNSEGVLNPDDIINRTGLYIPTCSLMYRPEIKNNYPQYCQNCNVGDYPLQISAAMKGTVYYFDKAMSVYRVENSSSWAGHQKFKSVDPARLHIVRSQMEMFKGFANDYPKFQKVYNNKIAEHIIKNMPFGNRPDSVRHYITLFSNEIEEFSFLWKLVLLIYRSPLPVIRKVFGRVFLRKYMQLKVFY